jgi:hypothetical protein
MNNDLKSDLDQLIIALNGATVTFKRKASAKNKTPDFDLDPDATHWQREGAAQALTAVLKFLLPYDKDDIRLPFKELLGLMVDIDEGRPNQLLKHKPRSSESSRKSTTDSAHIALAAVTVSLMIDNGEKLDDALEKVSSLIGLTPSQLRSRRDNISAGRFDQVAVELYSLWYPKYKGGPCPDEMIETCLKKLR